MKAETDNMYAIFLLKKNFRTDIIKTILEYLPITVSEILKEWKMTIILVGQEYKFMESQHDYKTRTETTNRGRRAPINIGKSKYNFSKDRKLRCFNYNTYRHIANNCQRLNKEKETRRCYTCDKVEYLAKNYMLGQNMRNRSIQENSDNEDNNT